MIKKVNYVEIVKNLNKQELAADMAKAKKATENVKPKKRQAEVAAKKKLNPSGLFNWDYYVDAYDFNLKEDDKAITKKSKIDSDKLGSFLFSLFENSGTLSIPDDVSDDDTWSFFVDAKKFKGVKTLGEMYDRMQKVAEDFEKKYNVKLNRKSMMYDPSKGLPKSGTETAATNKRKIVDPIVGQIAEVYDKAPKNRQYNLRVALQQWFDVDSESIKDGKQFAKKLMASDPVLADGGITDFITEHKLVPKKVIDAWVKKVFGE